MCVGKYCVYQIMNQGISYEIYILDVRKVLLFPSGNWRRCSQQIGQIERVVVVASCGSRAILRLFGRFLGMISIRNEFLPEWF